MAKCNTQLTDEQVARIAGPLLSSDQAAAMIGIHPTTLRNWRMARVGPDYQKVGVKVVYQYEAVVEWLAARTVVSGDCKAGGAGNESQQERALAA